MTIGLLGSVIILALFVLFLFWLGGVARTYGPLSWILVIPIIVLIVLCPGLLDSHLLSGNGVFWIQATIVAIFLYGFWEAESG